MTAFLSDLTTHPRVDHRVRWTFYIASALVAALLVSLIVRRTGSHDTPVDGWGVDLFELSMGAMCIRRPLAQLLVKAGADIIVGTHAHVLLGGG